MRAGPKLRGGSFFSVTLPSVVRLFVRSVVPVGGEVRCKSLSIQRKQLPVLRRPLPHLGIHRHRPHRSNLFATRSVIVTTSSNSTCGRMPASLQRDETDDAQKAYTFTAACTHAAEVDASQMLASNNAGLSNSGITVEGWGRV